MVEKFVNTLPLRFRALPLEDMFSFENVKKVRVGRERVGEEGGGGFEGGGMQDARKSTGTPPGAGEACMWDPAFPCSAIWVSHRALPLESMFSVESAPGRSERRGTKRGGQGRGQS